MCLGYLLLIGLDPLIDLVPVGAVVADGGLYEAERNLEIACRLSGVTTVVAYGYDDLPHVLAGSHQPGASACWSVGEPDERMLIHPQPLFHIPLCQGARGQVHALRVSAETGDRGIVQTNAQGMIHVVHCSTARYDSQRSALRQPVDLGERANQFRFLIRDRPGSSLRHPARCLSARDRALDPKTAALLQVAVSVAIGSPGGCLEWSVGRALGAIADVLLAIAPVAGLGRIVAAAPEVAIALGYDIAIALEELDGP